VKVYPVRRRAGAPGLASGNAVPGPAVSDGSKPTPLAEVSPRSVPPSHADQKAALDDAWAPAGSTVNGDVSTVGPKKRGGWFNCAGAVPWSGPSVPPVRRGSPPDGDRTLLTPADRRGPQRTGKLRNRTHLRPPASLVLTCSPPAAGLAQWWAPYPMLARAPLPGRWTSGPLAQTSLSTPRRVRTFRLRTDSGARTPQWPYQYGSFGWEDPQPSYRSSSPTRGTKRDVRAIVESGSTAQGGTLGWCEVELLRGAQYWLSFALSRASPVQRIRN